MLKFAKKTLEMEVSLKKQIAFIYDFSKSET